MINRADDPQGRQATYRVGDIVQDRHWGQGIVTAIEQLTELGAFAIIVYFASRGLSHRYTPGEISLGTLRKFKAEVWSRFARPISEWMQGAGKGPVRAILTVRGGAPQVEGAPFSWTNMVDVLLKKSQAPYMVDAEFMQGVFRERSALRAKWGTRAEPPTYIDTLLTSQSKILDRLKQGEYAQLHNKITSALAQGKLPQVDPMNLNMAELRNILTKDVGLNAKEYEEVMLLLDMDLSSILKGRNYPHLQSFDRSFGRVRSTEWLPQAGTVFGEAAPNQEILGIAQEVFERKSAELDSLADEVHGIMSRLGGGRGNLSRLWKGGGLRGGRRESQIRDIKDTLSRMWGELRVQGIMESSSAVHFRDLQQFSTLITALENRTISREQRAELSRLANNLWLQRSSMQSIVGALRERSRELRAVFRRRWSEYAQHYAMYAEDVGGSFVLREVERTGQVGLDILAQQPDYMVGRLLRAGDSARVTPQQLREKARERLLRKQIAEGFYRTPSLGGELDRSEAKYVEGELNRVNWEEEAARVNAATGNYAWGQGIDPLTGQIYGRRRVGATLVEDLAYQAETERGWRQGGWRGGFILPNWMRGAPEYTGELGERKILGLEADLLAQSEAIRNLMPRNIYIERLLHGGTPFRTIGPEGNIDPRMFRVTGYMTGGEEIAPGDFGQLINRRVEGGGWLAKALSADLRVRAELERYAGDISIGIPEGYYPADVDELYSSEETISMGEDWDRVIRAARGEEGSLPEDMRIKRTAGQVNDALTRFYEQKEKELRWFPTTIERELARDRELVDLYRQEISSKNMIGQAQRLVRMAPSSQVAEIRTGQLVQEQRKLALIQTAIVNRKAQVAINLKTIVGWENASRSTAERRSNLIETIASLTPREKPIYLKWSRYGLGEAAVYSSEATRDVRQLTRAMDWLVQETGGNPMVRKWARPIIPTGSLLVNMDPRAYGAGRPRMPFYLTYQDVQDIFFGQMTGEGRRPWTETEFISEFSGRWAERQQMFPGMLANTNELATNAWRQVLERVLPESSRADVPETFPRIMIPFKARMGLRINNLLARMPGMEAGDFDTLLYMSLEDAIKTLDYDLAEGRLHISDLPKAVMDKAQQIFEQKVAAEDPQRLDRMIRRIRETQLGYGLQPESLEAVVERETTTGEILGGTREVADIAGYQGGTGEMLGEARTAFDTSYRQRMMTLAATSKFGATPEIKAQATNDLIQELYLMVSTSDPEVLARPEIRAVFTGFGFNIQRSRDRDIFWRLMFRDPDTQEMLEVTRRMVPAVDPNEISQSTIGVLNRATGQFRSLSNLPVETSMTLPEVMRSTFAIPEGIVAPGELEGLGITGPWVGLPGGQRYYGRMLMPPVGTAEREGQHFAWFGRENITPYFADIPGREGFMAQHEPWDYRLEGASPQIIKRRLRQNFYRPSTIEEGEQLVGLAAEDLARRRVRRMWGSPIRFFREEIAQGMLELWGAGQWNKLQGVTSVEELSQVLGRKVGLTREDLAGLPENVIQDLIEGGDATIVDLMERMKDPLFRGQQTRTRGFMQEFFPQIREQAIQAVRIGKTEELPTDVLGRAMEKYFRQFTQEITAPVMIRPDITVTIPQAFQAAAGETFRISQATEEARKGGLIRLAERIADVSGRIRGLAFTEEGRNQLFTIAGVTKQIEDAETGVQGAIAEEKIMDVLGARFKEGAAPYEAMIHPAQVDWMEDYIRLPEKMRMAGQTFTLDPRDRDLRKAVGSIIQRARAGSADDYWTLVRWAEESNTPVLQKIAIRELKWMSPNLGLTRVRGSWAPGGRLQFLRQHAEEFGMNTPTGRADADKLWDYLYRAETPAGKRFGQLVHGVRLQDLSVQELRRILQMSEERVGVQYPGVADPAFLTPYTRRVSEYLEGKVTRDIFKIPMTEIATRELAPTMGQQMLKVIRKVPETMARHKEVGIIAASMAGLYALWSLRTPYFKEEEVPSTDATQMPDGSFIEPPEIIKRRGQTNLTQMYEDVKIRIKAKDLRGADPEQIHGLLQTYFSQMTDTKNFSHTKDTHDTRKPIDHNYVDGIISKLIH